MPLVHTLASYITDDGLFSGLLGMQADQRDFSPFLIHFTSYRSMELLRSTLQLQAVPLEINQLLAKADDESLSVVNKISATKILKASKPKNKRGEKHLIKECVCFSECNISGIISHAERYGRYGFIFRKCDLFHVGCRPCLYVDREIYTFISINFANESIETEKGRLYSLTNLYCPPGSGKVQDFTHEREWRLFQDLSLDDVTPIMLIAPSKHTEEVSALFPTIKNIVPIDYLYQMGA